MPASVYCWRASIYACPRDDGQEQAVSDTAFVVSYIQSCTSGALRAADCGPMWHLFVIGALLFGAVATLLIMRLRPRPLPEKA
jgi:hypothetical protein